MDGKCHTSTYVSNRSVYYLTLALRYKTCRSLQFRWGESVECLIVTSLGSPPIEILREELTLGILQLETYEMYGRELRSLRIAVVELYLIERVAPLRSSLRAIHLDVTCRLSPHSDMLLATLTLLLGVHLVPLGSILREEYAVDCCVSTLPLEYYLVECSLLAQIKFNPLCVVILACPACASLTVGYSTCSLCVA